MTEPIKEVTNNSSTQIERVKAPENWVKIVSPEMSVTVSSHDEKIDSVAKIAKNLMDENKIKKGTTYTG